MGGLQNTASIWATMAQGDPKTIPKTVERRSKTWCGWDFGDRCEGQPCIVCMTSRGIRQHHVMSLMCIVSKSVTIMVIISVIVVVDVVVVAIWIQAPKGRGLPNSSLGTKAQVL